MGMTVTARVDCMRGSNLEQCALCLKLSSGQDNAFDCVAIEVK